MVSKVCRKMWVVEMLVAPTSKIVPVYINLISVKIFVPSNAYGLLKEEQRLPSRRNSNGVWLITQVTKMELSAFQGVAAFWGLAYFASDFSICWEVPPTGKPLCSCTEFVPKG